jgi:Tripartite tricarboxylate transporter TctB family
MTGGDSTGRGSVDATGTASAAEASAVPRGTAPAPAADVRPAGRRLSGDTVADLVITGLLMALFGWAFVEANQWSSRAALFPHLVAGTMFVLSGLYLVQVLLRVVRQAKGAGTAAAGPADPVATGHDASGHLPAGHVAEPHGNEDDVNEDDVEYVFQTAGARRWAAALGWIAGFFVLLFVAGLYVTAPLFSLLYLRFAGRRTWLLSVIYAAVAGLVLYLAFEVSLGIPTPPGLFLD